MNWSVRGKAVSQQIAINEEVAHVLGEPLLIAIPFESLVALLLVEEDFKLRARPSLFAEVMFHLSNNIGKFRLIPRFSPPQVIRGPSRIDGHVHEGIGCGPRRVPANAEPSSTGPNMPVELVPADNVLLGARARQLRRET